MKGYGSKAFDAITKLVIIHKPNTAKKEIINLDKITISKYLNYGAYPTNTVRHLIYKVLEEKN